MCGIEAAAFLPHFDQSAPAPGGVTIAGRRFGRGTTPADPSVMADLILAGCGMLVGLVIVGGALYWAH